MISPICWIEKWIQRVASFSIHCTFWTYNQKFLWRMLSFGAHHSALISLVGFTSRTLKWHVGLRCKIFCVLCPQAFIEQNGEPKVTSGKQEKYESIFNHYIWKLYELGLHMINRWPWGEAALRQYRCWNTSEQIQRSVRKVEHFGNPTGINSYTCSSCFANRKSTKTDVEQRWKGHAVVSVTHRVKA